ncbi:hypothetical protein GFS60_04496 [Rhodococcus sp. WAY2]|nr:hypothetical protein GFS60_04496 [Rhodococcus sp. WAY2]
MIAVDATAIRTAISFIVETRKFPTLGERVTTQEAPHLDGHPFW